MPTSKGRGGWSWMRAVGDRHDQPCQEREGLAASLSAHTTTRPQGRLRGQNAAGAGVVLTRWGERDSNPHCTLFESAVSCLIGLPPQELAAAPTWGRRRAIARRPGLAPGLPVLESGVLAARPSTQAHPRRCGKGRAPCAPGPRVLPDGIEPPSQRLKGARSATELEKQTRGAAPI